MGIYEIDEDKYMAYGRPLYNEGKYKGRESQKTQEEMRKLKENTMFMTSKIILHKNSLCACPIQNKNSSTIVLVVI